MSNSVASKSNENIKRIEMSKMRGGEDEGDEGGENLIEIPPAGSSPISTTDSTAPAITDQFMHTPELRRHIFEFAPGDTLMTLRLAAKGYDCAANAFINEGMRSGEIIVHEWKNMTVDKTDSRDERPPLATRVIFLLNITKVGFGACSSSPDLINVVIPEGVKKIGAIDFGHCRNLTTVSFPAS
ncbi:hypothetical protein TrLO_g9967 [Triparma laevis f. longispina]|uniref:Uncharacterized protein n=1 Tax=Triparma laevis f. longispina TaxID=1714387 RepID=A0A9W7DP40_9STRA|nr:hypothetical protein TrLO_g9967 [Triparma laevis f. longispina]